MPGMIVPPWPSMAWPVLPSGSCASGPIQLIRRALDDQRLAGNRRGTGPVEKRCVADHGEVLSLGHGATFRAVSRPASDYWYESVENRRLLA
jgi:hypothetical protein